MNKPRKDGTEHVTEVKKCEDYMTREAVIGNKAFKQTNPYNWKPVSNKDFKKMKAVKKAKKNGTWVEEEKEGEVFEVVENPPSLREVFDCHPSNVQPGFVNIWNKVIEMMGLYQPTKEQADYVRDPVNAVRYRRTFEYTDDF